MGYLYNQESKNQLRKKLRNNMPPAEIFLWNVLKNKQINGLKFRRQYSIGPFVVDFYCPKLKLAIEADGDSHFSEEAYRYDKKRQTYIERYKIKFLRFTNDEIYEFLDGVVQIITEETKKLATS
ncbi:endonuclease domain-containing protein [Patescibacteria group bacterium]|nr:endonuclease domain-containing protein [Patescibacteria group bacterium]MBU1682857.1 endonuclease domain-containing protein [Patescibacteria group bacterium]